ncbi:MAG: hypothetical protein GQ535_08545 [Rhodobacteraceae bacterium]|nr:hypothetical protein [Paracoccaceae bacterium]
MKPIYLIFIRAGGWIAVLFVWLGLIIAASGVLALQNAKRLAADGVATTAQITKKSAQELSRRTTQGIKRPSGTDYFVEYVLATPDGPLAGNAKVNRNYFFAVREGGTVALRYLPQSPEIHELYEGALHRSGQATSVVGAGFTGLGLLITLGFGLIARQGARLLGSGVSVQATVFKKSNFVLITRLRFGFKLPNGRTETGKSFWRFGRVHDGIKPRDLIEVRYDSAQSRTSFWLDDLTRRK